MQTKPTLVNENIEVLDAKVQSNKLNFAIGDADLFEKINSGKIVLLRGAFKELEIRNYRNIIANWGKNVEPFPEGISAGKPFLNFHRRDKESPLSTVPHLFHLYGFGKPIDLPLELNTAVTRLSSVLLDIQNRLAGTEFDLTDGEIKTLVARHIRGGGYTQTHRHTYLPQKVSAVLNLSEPGVDYYSGGYYIRNNDREINMHSHFLLGDIMLWRYDLPHGISEIDADMDQKWDGDDGFWFYALEMISASSRTSAD